MKSISQFHEAIYIQTLEPHRKFNDGNADNENSDIIWEKRENYRNINISTSNKTCQNITLRK